MGCVQSTIEMDESVMRCKERKRFMQDAVAARNAFAAAHAAYGVALKHTGGALYDYAQSDLLLLHDSVPGGTSHHHHRSGAGNVASSSSSSAAPAPVVAPPIDKLPPPPPPLPDLSPPLQRSASMPEMAIPKAKKKRPPAEASIREEDVLEEDESEEEWSGADRPTHADDDYRGPTGSSSPPPPPQISEPDSNGPWDYLSVQSPPPNLSQPEEQPSWTHQEVRPTKKATAAQPPSSFVEEVPPKAETSRPPKPVKKSKPPVHHQQATPAGGVPESKKGKMVAAAVPSMSLMQVVDELYEHFLRASQTTHDVGKMLEATRLHYHSNFADNRGHIDHSARVMQVITWNRSIKGMPQTDEGTNEFDDEEWETHAIILDKMLAWEKKLYDEVKVGEVMKIEYQRKIARLNKLKKHGAHPDAVAKAESVVNHFHTRYIVDMQSMDSLLSEINRLRDQQLYPNLVALVDGMDKMWEAMHSEHLAQYNIITSLKVPDLAFAPRETSDHHERAKQLWKTVADWQSQFDQLMNHQKDYIQDLNNWLKLNLIPVESSSKGAASPQREHVPPIKNLLTAWHNELERLPVGPPKNSINNFSGVIHAILLHQEEELKLKEKCENLSRELERKKRAFEYWYHKYMEKKAMQAEVVNPEGGGEGSIQDPVAERKTVVEDLERNLKKEEEDYRKLCKTVREKSLGSLRNQLPQLFKEMSEFSSRSSQMYKRLISATTPQSTGIA